jgi:hypothetical protein
LIAKLAVLFMTTAKHSRCGCLNRDGVPSNRVPTVANIDAAEPHTASASINWQTESAFGGKPDIEADIAEWPNLTLAV